ncbi:MAG: Elongation factor G, partial [bacterium 42_11]
MGYSSSEIRNVGLIAHGGAGKTSLAEAILFNGGSITRLGRVDDGNTVMDFDPDEIKRKISISSAVAFVDYRGTRINVVDMPGYADFIGEVLASIRVCDSVISVVCAVSGVEVNTEKTWEYATELNLPKMVFINKLDRERADFYRVYEMVKSYLSKDAIPLLLPVGAEQNFRGVVDLLRGKAYIYEKDKSGKFKEEEIPADMKDKVAEMKEALIEKIVETDEALMERYLEGGEISSDEIISTMRKAVLSGELVPVLCGSSVENIGIRQLMDYIVDLLPSPVERPPVKGTHPETGEELERKPDVGEPFSAWAFKVALDPYVGKLVYLRVWSGEVEADATVLNSSKKDEERLSNLSYPMGKSLVKAEKAVAGDIVVIAKPKVSGFGDTLCSKDAPIVFPSVTFPEPVYFLAIEPKSKGDEDRLSNALQRLMEADPTFKAYKNTETGDTIIAGMGDIHLDVAIEKMKSRYNVELNVRMPKIPYRETIKGRSKAEGKYVKQSGGRGQYGWVWIEYEPLPRG